MDGNALLYRTQRDIPTADPGPRTLELRVRPGKCSDGMSDRQFPMTAVLELGDATRTGCAWYQLVSRAAHVAFVESRLRAAR